MAKQKKQRIQRKTVHIAAEGAHDLAFLKHLKALYDRSRDTSISVSSANGKGPSHIIDYAIGKQKHVGYQVMAVFMDTDIPWPQDDVKNANDRNVALFGSSPLCLEGMLLSILGQAAPNNNEGCKRLLHPQLAGSPSTSGSYSTLFPKQLLDQQRANNKDLDELIYLIENGKLK